MFKAFVVVSLVIVVIKETVIIKEDMSVTNILLFTIVCSILYGVETIVKAIKRK